MNQKLNSFINVQDIGPLPQALDEAMEIKADRYKYLKFIFNWED